MIFKNLTCPTCKARAIGTLELIPGVALLSDPDEDGEVHYAGETVVLWDGQKTQRGENGRLLLTCDEGHTWEAVSPESAHDG